LSVSFKGVITQLINDKTILAKILVTIVHAELTYAKIWQLKDKSTSFAMQLVSIEVKLLSNNELISIAMPLISFAMSLISGKL